MPPPAWLTIAETMALLRKSRAELYRMMARGELAFAQEGRHRRIWVRSIDAYLERRLRETTDPTWEA